MTNAMRMLMLTNRKSGKENETDPRWDKHEHSMTGGDGGTMYRMPYSEPAHNRYPDTNREYPDSSELMSGDPSDRSRGRRGREHYDNGRYAPDNDVAPMNRIGFVTGSEVQPNYSMTGGYDRSYEVGHDKSGHEMKMGTGVSSTAQRIDKETAMMWMQQLENEDGTKGAHWTMEQTKQVMAQHGIQCDPLEFYVALNMIYSDYGKILKKHGVGDKIAVYADLAKAFLDDKDAMPNKLENYYNAVVKH